jgi:hypothetical protein
MDTPVVNLMVTLLRKLYFSDLQYDCKNEDNRLTKKKHKDIQTDIIRYDVKEKIEKKYCRNRNYL